MYSWSVIDNNNICFIAQALCQIIRVILALLPPCPLMHYNDMDISIGM